MLTIVHKAVMGGAFGKVDPPPAQPQKLKPAVHSSLTSSQQQFLRRQV